MIQRVFIVFILSILFYSCTYRKEFVEPKCETENLQFSSGIINEIVQTKCAITGCHISGGSGTGDFTKYTQLKSAVDNGSFGQQVFVTKKMPQSGSLTDCQLSQLQAWVNNGAPN